MSSGSGSNDSRDKVLAATVASLPAVTVSALTGAELTRIVIDFQSRLRFADVEVVIESVFTLRFAEKTFALDPEDRGQPGPLLALYPGCLLSIAVDADGTLRLHFASGAVLDVPQDPQYKAWQISGPGGALTVCLPGTDGGLAVWS